MNIHRALLAVGLAAYAYELSKRFSGPILPIAVWIGLGLFSFWTVWASPKKWGLKSGMIFSGIIILQGLMLASYLKSRPDPAFWSIIVPALIPLTVVTACFYAHRFIPETEKA